MQSSQDRQWQLRLEILASPYGALEKCVRLFDEFVSLGEACVGHCLRENGDRNKCSKSWEIF